MHPRFATVAIDEIGPLKDDRDKRDGFRAFGLKILRTATPREGTSVGIAHRFVETVVMIAFGFA